MFGLKLSFLDTSYNENRTLCDSVGVDYTQEMHACYLKGIKAKGGSGVSVLKVARQVGKDISAPCDPLACFKNDPEAQGPTPEGLLAMHVTTLADCVGHPLIVSTGYHRNGKYLSAWRRSKPDDTLAIVLRHRIA